MIDRRKLLSGAAAAATLGAASFKPALSADARIDISSLWGADKPFQKVVDAFNARQTGVTANNRFDGDYQQMATKALASIAAGRPPALMFTGWKFGFYAKRTLGARDLREIDAAKANALLANFVPAVHPLVTVDGSLIGLPWAMSTPITYINMDLWRAAGLDPNIPAAFDTDWLYARARELDGKLKGHPTYRSAIALSNNEWTSQAFVQNAGGFILDEAGRVVVDRPEARRGMELYAQPAHEGLWLPVGAGEQDSAFESGAIAIMTTSSTRAASYPKALKFEVRTAKFPGVPGRPRRMNSGGNFLAVYARNDEQARAALTFLEFCASAEGQRIWSEVGYLNTSVHPIPLVDPAMEPAAAQLADGLTAETIWPGSRGLEGQDLWRKWVTRILLRQAGVEEGLKRAAAELTPVLAS